MTSILTTPYQESKVYDADAQKFVAESGITDESQIVAINEMCLSYKLCGIWDKMKLIAPFVGGTATTHAFNLKTGLPEITFHGGLIHNSNGVSGNAIDGYADLGYKPSDFDQNRFSVSFYNQYENASNVFVGSKASYSRTELFVLDQIYYAVNNFNYSAIPNLPGIGSIGFFDITRESEDTITISKDGIVVGTGTETSLVPNDLNLFAFARNNEGTPDYFSNVKSPFISLGEPLTIAEKRMEFIIVQQFQIALGRNN